MAQAPLREHYSSDEEYFRELDIFNTTVSIDLENITVAAGGDVATGTDEEDYPTVGDLRIGYQGRYLHTRYATNPTGTSGFTNDYTTIVGLTVYQGLRNSDTPVESGNPADYTWREIVVATGWKPNYRIAGGRLVDWDFSATTPTNYIVDVGSNFDLDNFASGATGPSGADSIFVEMRTDNGDIFKNDEGMTEATIFVYVGGNEQSNLAHDSYNYRWVFNNTTVYVDNNRNLLNINGSPAVVGGSVPAGGMVADSTINFGSLLRSINIGNEDITNKAQIDCIVSNIPD